MRVYELAEELGIESGELIEMLEDEFDLEVSSHMSGVDEDVEELVRDVYEDGRTEPRTEQPTEELEEEEGEEEKAEEAPEPEKPAGAGLESEAAEEPSPEPEEAGEEPSQPAREAEDVLTIRGSVTTEQLAEKLGIAPNEAIKTLMEEGSMVTINQTLSEGNIELLAQKYGYGVEYEEIEEELPWREEFSLDLDVPEEELVTRPPVVTVMGHVDHGKTQLLDTIRETNVISGESGGITQHIGAYRVERPEGDVVFIDTPGHEAFTAMRARGARVTDLVVLVVAGDDGVMPQTVESINHARAADVPIVVAVNKMDLPDADADRVRQQLTEYDLIPEEWGGDTIVVEISALEGDGIDELLEMISLQAELMELVASPSRTVKGTVIEAEMKEGMGPTATVLVQQGTLKRGQSFVAGATSGKVRAMINSQGERIDEARPGDPVEVLGFNDLPSPGDFFEEVETESEARDVAEERKQKLKVAEQEDQGRVTLDQLQEFLDQGKVKNLNIVIKADTQGSIEVLQDAFEGLSTGDVEARVIHTGVGAINESDVMLADASDGVIVGFNVRPDSRGRSLAQQKGVEITTYSVIYEAIQDIRDAMEGLLEPDIEEQVIGHAEVREVFQVPGAGKIAGCYVEDGRVERGAHARVVRDGVIVHDGEISSLKRFKEDVTEVTEDYECGIGLGDFNDVKEGDRIEVYQEREVAATLS